MYLLVFLVLCALIWLIWRYKHRRMIKMAEQIPGPPTVPLLGNALLFMGNSEEFIEKIQKLLSEYGDVLRMWLGPDLNIIVNDPDDLKLLLSSHKTKVKGPMYKYITDVLGDGILSGSGLKWRKHRKLANPNFGKRTIESYSDVFNSEVDVLLKNLHHSKEQINIYNYIVQTTSYVVCRTIMGLTREQTLNLSHIENIIRESPRLYDIIFDRMTKWYLQINPVFWLTKSYRIQKRTTRIINKFCNHIIQHRIEKLKHSYNYEELLYNEQDSVANTKLSVVDRFILSHELNRDEIIQETMTVFTASQEATAKMCSFLILMMAYHPESQEKLYGEIVNVLGNKDRAVYEEDFRAMHYLEMVVKEVLRLFPIGAMLQRTATEDIAISSYIIPAGSSIVAPIFQLQRHPRFWRNPDQFDPERFSPENMKLRNPNCYIPFSAGPMDCLGRYYGTNLMKTICVRILREFEVTSLETYKDLRLKIAISVKSVNGYPVILKPRKDINVNTHQSVNAESWIDVIFSIDIGYITPSNQQYASSNWIKQWGLIPFRGGPCLCSGDDDDNDIPENVPSCYGVKHVVHTGGAVGKNNLYK